MTEFTGCPQARASLGVYVLGAIGPAERAEVDAHLAGCAGCREELAGLAGLPALLGRVPAAEAARIAGAGPGEERPAPAGPAPGAGDTLTPLLHTMAQRRRVARWRALAAAAAVLLIAAGSAIGAIRMSASPTPHLSALHWETVSATDTATHTHLEVKYAPMPWGTRVDADVSGIPAGTTCQFWVLGSHGDKWVAGSWTVASTWHGTWYPGSSPVPASAVRGFEITSGNTVLVRVAA